MIKKINSFKYLKYFYKLFFTSMFLILLAPKAFADVTYTASVDKTKITLEDTINLSLTASGGTPEEPDIPETKGLEFVPRGTSSQMQITNGSFTSTETYNFQVIPKASGKLTIPSITTQINGTTYSTQPINIEVIESAQRADIDTTKNILLAVKVSNKNPYVNEQVIYTFRFYTKVQTELREIKYPDFKGFWTEDIGKENVFEQILNGQRYQVVETHKAIYPTKSGEIVISPLNFLVEVLYQDDSMGGIFTTTRKEVEQYKTTAVKLNVKPLPTAPKNFSGIVGRDVKIESKIDNQTLKQGDSANLEIKVEGIGNITDLKKFPLKVNDLKVYEDKPIEDATLKENNLLWSKKFKFALVPLKKGGIDIQAPSLTYFDVKSGNYKTINARGYKLFSETAEQTIKKNNPENKINNEVKKDEIEPIFENVSINDDSFNKNIIYFILCLFLLSLGFLIYITKYTGKVKIKSFVEKSSKNNNLLKKIRAENSLDNMSKLLKEYLNYKYNINDFSEDKIRENIKDPKVSGQFIDLINQYNYLKYSGSLNKTKEEELLSNTKNIIESTK